MMPNWMNIGAGSGQATQGAAEVAYGLYLDKQARNMPHEYKIPAEIQANLTEANQRALQGLPEAQKQEYLTSLQRSNAMANTQLGSLNAGLRGVAGANNSLNTGYMNLLGQDAAARAANQNAVYGQRQNMADYKDQAFTINQYNPYIHTRNQAEALQSAGTQQVGNAMQTAAGSTGNSPAPLDKSIQKTPQVSPQGTGYAPTNYAMSPYQTQGQPITTVNPYQSQQVLGGTGGSAMGGMWSGYGF